MHLVHRAGIILLLNAGHHRSTARVAVHLWYENALLTSPLPESKSVQHVPYPDPISGDDARCIRCIIAATGPDWGSDRLGPWCHGQFVTSAGGLLSKPSETCAANNAEISDASSKLTETSRSWFDMVVCHAT